MKRHIVYTLVLFVSTFALSAKAEKKGDILRGGFGFLFADTNQLTNPGQMALNKGFAVEANGSLQSSVMTLGPSFAWGNGSFALGGAYTRSGTDLFADGSFTSTVKAVAGLSLAKGKATVGASYSTGLEGGTSTGGDIGAVLNFNGGSGKGRGMQFGLGFTANTETLVKGANAALGFAFMRGAGIEGNFKFSDIEDLSVWEAGGNVLLGSKAYYLGFGFTHTSAGENEINGRAGLILGKVDVSGFIRYPTATGGTPTYGATFRATF